VETNDGPTDSVPFEGSTAVSSGSPTAHGPVPFSKIGVFVAVVRRSGPHLIEASLIPTALFYSGLW
jgi:hypothetical protein